jgi:hypothetical protein
MTLLRHVPHPFAQALLTQPRRVQGDRALRALTSSFAAVAGYREPSAVSVECALPGRCQFTTSWVSLRFACSTGLP